MNAVDVARLMGKCNGYEIAYRLSELRRVQSNPILTQEEVSGIVTAVLQANAQEFPQDQPVISADPRLLAEYTTSLFATLGVQHVLPHGQTAVQ